MKLKRPASNNPVLRAFFKDALYNIPLILFINGIVCVIFFYALQNNYKIMWAISALFGLAQVLYVCIGCVVKQKYIEELEEQRS